MSNEQVGAMGVAVGDGGDLGCGGGRGRSGSLSRHQVRNNGVEQGKADAASGGSPEGGRAGHVPWSVVFSCLGEGRDAMVRGSGDEGRSAGGEQEDRRDGQEPNRGLRSETTARAYCSEASTTECSQMSASTYSRGYGASEPKEVLTQLWAGEQGLAR